MNKINLKNVCYFLTITSINILTVYSLFTSAQYLYYEFSTLFRVIIMAILFCLSLCSAVFMVKSKNDIKHKDLLSLILFSVFSIILFFVHIITTDLYLDWFISEEIRGFILNYHLSFLIIPNILLNVYSILMSVDKK